MLNCDKCGIELIGPIRRVRNYYPEYGFPHDTEMLVCKKCNDKFIKYITKKYNNFFDTKKEVDNGRKCSNRESG